MTNPSDLNADHLAVLDWYRAMGVDCTLTSQPIDWRARAGEPSNSTARTTETPSPGPQSKSASAADRAPPIRHAPLRSPAESESAARTLAEKAKSFADLKAALQSFDGCALSKTAKNLCFYRGSENAPLAIIGEAPGRDEDIAGKPFVGRAGQLLDKMLAAISLDEPDVHITNIVYWRPPGNRTPTPVEAQACRPFLERQMELLQPKCVLVLGGAAAKNIFETSDGIMRLRGKWRPWTVKGRDIPVMASLHPAYLLRTPAAKRLAWRDLIQVKCALEK